MRNAGLKTMSAAVLAATLLSGCASTRGGQNIACDGFDDFALAPKPHAIVSDIQRYGVKNRGGETQTAAQPTMRILAAPTATRSAAEEISSAPADRGAGENGPIDAMIGEAVFGMGDAELEQEARRLRREFDAEKARRAPGPESSARVTGGVTISGLPQPSRALPVPTRSATEGAPASQGNILVTSSLAPRNVLLLSGGGQWGAYGAGLFLGMACTEAVSPVFDPASVPCLMDTPSKARVIKAEAIDFAPINAMDIGVITGVSTGSLQSLLLMVILDKTQTDATRIAALQQMLDSYAPKKQSELVDYDGFLAIVFQGSVAGTKALRGHVSRVLEQTYGFRDAVARPDGSFTGDPVPTRRLVDQIAFSPITTMVGVVQGRDGDFRSVNMKRMVREIQPDDGDGNHEQTQRATNCVLATTLASSAMPVFHQQLRVVANDGDGDGEKGVTLFDGGVRRSVFISELGNAFKRRYTMMATYMGRELFAMADKEGKVPRMYVLRNGPTTSVWNPKIDGVDGAIGQALRAYELLVNELEVGSIASLRLANPYGPIFLSTADGSENREFARLTSDASAAANPVLRPGCKKNGEMFDPAFMVCLQNFGVRRGMTLEVDKTGQTIPAFWPISEIDPRPGLAVPKPDNDN